MTKIQNGHESEWNPGDGDGQGGLAFCGSWGRKESDTTEQLNSKHGPTLQNKTQFPLQSVSPIRKLPYASYPSPSEGRQTENHNHRKLSNLITWTTALSNSMKLWIMLCRATQVMVERSDKMWSPGEGNGKPLQYSWLENPWTVWKGKMIGQWKKNSPGH